MPRMKFASLCLSVIIAASAMPGGAVAQRDPLAAAGAVDPLAVSPLHQVTLVTRDIRAARQFYASAMAMTPSATRSAAKQTITRLGLKAPGVEVVFARPTSGTAQVRVISPRAAPAPLRPDHVALLPGGLAMGMPVANQAARQALVKTAGFDSVVGPTTMTLPRGDGTSYTVGEIHYRAPDGVLVLGIDRGSMPPVGLIDPLTGVGGPAYASLIVEDLPGSERFMRDVLRYEKRRDAVFASSGPNGGLGLAEGQRFVFQQWFAPGASSGYVILMKMLDRAAAPANRGSANRGSTNRRPASGMAMLGFEADDLAAVEQRARAMGSRVIAAPDARTPSLTLAMPDGFLIEVSPRQGGKR